MADGKIYITISDSRSGSGGGVNSDADKKEPKNALIDFMKHKFFNYIESQAKEIANYSVNNIGNFTGNYQAQRDAQFLNSMISKITGLGSSALSAFVGFGGGVQGGVAAALVVATSVVSEGITTYQRYYSEMFQNKKMNRNIDMMRKRLGLEGLTDGSRTGGY